MRSLKLDLEQIALFMVFLFYISTNSFWGYQLFHDSDIFPAIACLVPSFLFVLSYRKSTHNASVIQLIIAAMYIVIVVSSGFSIKYILFYGMCVTMLFDAHISERTKYLKLFYYLSLIFVVGSFVYLYLPSLYESRILPAFVRSTQYPRLLKWINRSVYLIVPGFANQTSFNACHFVYGLGYLFCARFAGEKLNARKIIIAVVLFISLVLTNKRAHFLFLFLALIITYYMIAVDKDKLKKIGIIVVIVALIMAVIYFLITYVKIGVFIKLKQMLMDYQNDEDITDGRFIIYENAMMYFFKNPLFGIGWEKYSSLPDAIYGGHIHNIYIELLCETGIVGFIVFVSFFIYTLTKAIKNCKLAVTQEDKTTAGFCLFMQLFFLLYGLTGNPLYDPPYYIPYFLCCAYTIHKRYRPLVGVPSYVGKHFKTTFQTLNVRSHRF